MFEGILLDLDGTLADSLESLAVSCNQALEKVHLPVQPMEAYKKFAGDGPPTLVRKALNAAGDKEGKYYEEVLEEYQEALKDYKNQHVDTFEGMHEALKAIRDSGGKLAVITNKPQKRAVEVVENIFGKGFFHLIVGFSDRFPRKPDPSSTIYAMKELGIVPEKSMYVGDTDVDMKTGKGAGAFTVGVLWGFRDRQELEENGADCIISHPSELEQLWNR